MTENQRTPTEQGEGGEGEGRCAQHHWVTEECSGDHLEEKLAITNEFKYKSICSDVSLLFPSNMEKGKNGNNFSDIDT